MNARQRRKAKAWGETGRKSRKVKRACRASQQAFLSLRRWRKLTHWKKLRVQAHAQHLMRAALRQGRKYNCKYRPRWVVVDEVTPFTTQQFDHLLNALETEAHKWGGPP